MKRDNVHHIVKATLKLFLECAAFFALLAWWQDGPFRVMSVISFAIWMTASIAAPVLTGMLLLKPVLKHGTPAGRMRAFRENHIPLKIILLFTVLFSGSLVILSRMVPLFEIPFTYSALTFIGIGLIISTACMGVIRLIIGREKPPFYDWWEGAG